MAYFPIQVTGATAQFPLMRTRRWRTLETRTPGGHASRGLQPEARRVHWQLDYVDLTDVEAAALAELFEQSRGGLKSFGFVDPLANLMQGSEQIGQGQWDGGQRLERCGDRDGCAGGVSGDELRAGWRVIGAEFGVTARPRVLPELLVARRRGAECQAAHRGPIATSDEHGDVAAGLVHGRG